MINPAQILLLGLTLYVSLIGVTQASSYGVMFNDDSTELFYVTDSNSYLNTNSTQGYHFIYSQYGDIRNYLLAVDAEFEDQFILLNLDHTFTPKLAIYQVEFLQEKINGLAVGGIYRIPALFDSTWSANIDFNVAPRLLTGLNGRYLWASRIEFNYPLSINSYLNLGYRKIFINLENGVTDSFGQGLFFGLTTRY